MPEVLPLLPVRDMVMYPAVTLPLFLGREMSINAVEKSLSQDRLIVVAAQKDLTDEDPLPGRIYSMGVVSQIMRMLRLPDGRIKILIQGLEEGTDRRICAGKADVSCADKARGRAAHHGDHP